MNNRKRLISSAVIAASLLFGASAPVSADNTVLLGPIRGEFPFEVTDTDGNNCTYEDLFWTATLWTFDYIHVSGHGDKQTVHVLSKFSWDADVTGLTTGYEWKTRGGGKVTINQDALDGSPYREIFIENSTLKPVTEGAPRIRFHARIVVKEDGEGGVVESVDYEYKCIGR
jgi:hypothetical protein